VYDNYSQNYILCTSVLYNFFHAYPKSIRNEASKGEELFSLRMSSHKNETSQNGVYVSEILSKIKIRRKLLESVTTKIEDEGEENFFLDETVFCYHHHAHHKIFCFYLL
jgi:hypothetical protein